MASRVWRRFRDLLRAVRRDAVLRYGFGFLLAVDLGFTAWWGFARLLLNLEVTERWYDLRFLRIDAEGGWPEWFNYGQTLLTVILCARLTLLRRRLIYATLALVFAFVLADDALQIHERAGEFLAAAFVLEPMFGMRPVDFGELLVWAAAGSLIAPLVLAALLLLRSPRADAVDALALLLPFGALAFFGAGVDQLYHVLRDAFFGADILLGMLEDGGEMVAISTACAMAGALVRGGPAPDASS